MSPYKIYAGRMHDLTKDPAKLQVYLFTIQSEKSFSGLIEYHGLKYRPFASYREKIPSVKRNGKVIPRFTVRAVSVDEEQAYLASRRALGPS